MGALWLHCTGRDLRARWLQVLATALVLAVGVGAFAGLGGLREWRERSADESLAALRAADLRVDLADGAYVPAGRLRAALRQLPAGTVAATEERFVAASQIDASMPGSPVLVPARLVGIPVRPGGQAVDALAIKAGRGLETGSGAPAVLDWNFARHYDLPAQGRVRLAGLGEVEYQGLGVSPQYFVIVGEGGLLGAESGLAVVYLPLTAAQQAAGRAGQVNQLLVRVVPGQDLDIVAGAVQAALQSAVPEVGVSVTRADQGPVADFLYRDARNDQRTLTAFAILLLAGAALAAFNLVSRAVEAQRREIGIGMALGVKPRTLAIRPLALGAQIGMIGALLGVPVGIALAELFKGVFRDFLPLPVYAATFPTGRYLLGALVALAIPVLAVFLPVRRAISVTPVEAIRTGHRAAKGVAAAVLLRRVHLPGRPLAQMPLRNLARAPTVAHGRDRPGRGDHDGRRHPRGVRLGQRCRRPPASRALAHQPEPARGDPRRACPCRRGRGPRPCARVASRYFGAGRTSIRHRSRRCQGTFGPLACSTNTPMSKPASRCLCISSRR